MNKKIYIVFFIAIVLPLFSTAQSRDHIIDYQFLELISSVINYRPYKFFPNETDYMLFKDSITNGLRLTYCESTKKLYLLNGETTVVEYDLEAAKEGLPYKRTFTLPFNAQPQIDNSPNGQYLAFVDENHENLHVISTTSGNEVVFTKLGKKFYNGMNWCPFAFQSDQEILVSGMATAMLFNIESRKRKTISLGHSHKDYFVTSVTANGKISGIFENSSVTYEISNGKVVYVRPDVFWKDNNVNDYFEVRCATCNEKYNYYRKKTGDLIPNFCFCDESGRYVYEVYGPYPEICIGIRERHYGLTLGGYGYAKANLLLAFPNSKFFYWLDGVNLFLLVYESEIQVFNHELTPNEMEKQQLLSVIDSKEVDRFNEFVEDNPNSKYIEIAKQKRAECVAEIWDKTSKPSDYTLIHFNDVNTFIDNYGSYGDMTAARNELDNIYKNWYEQLNDNDIQSIDKYIKDYPTSPYLSQAKEKQKRAYKSGYDALCLEQSSQPYLDYVKNYPNSPYLEDVKERTKAIQQQEEEARIAEQKRLEEARIAEQKRLEEERIAEQKRKEAEALAEKKQQEEEQKRKEAEALAEKKRQEEERKRQMSANSKVNTWKLGNKLCNCQKNHVMVILDSWNEDKSSFKGQIVTSDVSKFEGQIMKKGSMVWFDTKGWHKCLEDEIAYCTNHDISNSSAEVSSGSSSKKDPPYKRGMELHCSWSYTYKEWVFAREKTGLVYLSGVIEDWNEDYSRVKIRITYYSDSGYNSSGKKYYVGSIHWEDPSFWKP